VWTWGKGEYYRLGLGRGEHVRRPTLVDQLKLVTIDHIAVGTLHCIAVSTQGDVSFYNYMFIYYILINIVNTIRFIVGVIMIMANKAMVQQMQIKNLD